MFDPENPDTDRRCDYCGNAIERIEDQTFIYCGPEDFALPHSSLTPQELADAVAHGIRAVGDESDRVLANGISKNVGFALHQQCFEDCALTELYEDAGIDL